MEQNTKSSHFASLSDDDATHIGNERAHRTFCTYLKEKNYGDVNFKNWSQETLSLPCHS